MRRISIALVVLLAAAAFPARAAQEISVKSLLPEMVDLEALAKRPSPYYKQAQASSYDRASAGPDKPNWFANGDAGQFVRAEDNDGRKEYVLMDEKGPGAVVRFWSANPAGIVRFYFDGAKTPQWECKLDELLTGKIAPLTDPFAYVASSGCNLYFPIPYSKGLKITVDEPGRGIYYHVGFRTYVSGTQVRTFTLSSLNEVKPLMESVAKKLTQADWASFFNVPNLENAHVEQLGPGESRTVVSLKGGARGSAIILLRAKLENATPEDHASAETWADPHAVQNMLRQVIVQIEFDGERCVEAPLGDFFCTAPGLNELHTLPVDVAKNGWLACRWVMPFHKSAKITLTNLGSVDAKLTIQAATKPFAFATDTYHFHAQWTIERSSTRPFKDMHFLNVKGDGVWVGVNAHVANPVPDWWGEGDEKVWVDGESFPSTFGTGSEDFFGYAWCNPTPFMRPYHAQPRADGPNNFGHTSVMRFQIFDRIPYAKSMQFDLELWHWAEVTLNYARTAYWYAKPGGTPPDTVFKTLLPPPYLSANNKVAGAIEGESLKSTATGGKVEVQGGFWAASAGAHLWWHEASVGDKLTVHVPVAETGDYEVVIGCALAHDYGVHKVRLIGGSDDARVTLLDLYDTGLIWKPYTLGTYRLKQGEFLLEVESAGRNTQAAPGNMFSLDYVLLKKK